MRNSIERDGDVCAGVQYFQNGVECGDGAVRGAIKKHRGQFRLSGLGANRHGGMGAPRSVQQGADTIIWLATEAPKNLTGKFLRNRRVISW